MDKKPLRDREQVQKAHDIIHAIVVREVELGLSPHMIEKYHIAHDVLSWVLEGPCGVPFEEILKATVAEASSRGYVFSRIQ